MNLIKLKNSKIKLHLIEENNTLRGLHLPVLENNLKIIDNK